MPAKPSRLNALLLRKELLVLESEVNRRRLGEDWKKVQVEASTLVGQFKHYGTYASVAATLAGGFSLLRKGRSKTATPAAKPSFLSSIFKGLRVATSVWLAVRGMKR